MDTWAPNADPLASSRMPNNAVAMKFFMIVHLHDRDIIA
jgi:hypothetical protein